MRRPLRLVALTALLGFTVNAWSQGLPLVHYHITGINGGPPVKTLYVYPDGSVELFVNNGPTIDTITDMLDSVELADLVDLFVTNNFDSLDSLHYGGCLSCPEFIVAYDGKTVRGSTPVTDQDLRAIVTGLNDLVDRLIQAAGVTAHRRVAERPTKSSVSAIALGNGKRYAVQCWLVRRCPVSGGLYNMRGQIASGSYTRARRYAARDSMRPE